MGFLDKVKEAGKSALKGALTMASTSYGTVTSGKHKLCKIAMNSTYDKLVFVKVATVEAEYVIKDTVKTFGVHYEKDMDAFHEIKLVFNDGEEAVVLLTVNKEQGSALPSAEQRIAAQYKNAGELVESLAKHVPEIPEDTKIWVNKIMRYCGKGNLF